MSRTERRPRPTNSRRNCGPNCVVCDPNLRRTTIRQLRRRERADIEEQRHE